MVKIIFEKLNEIDDSIEEGIYAVPPDTKLPKAKIQKLDLYGKGYKKEPSQSSAEEMEMLLDRN